MHDIEASSYHTNRAYSSSKILLRVWVAGFGDTSLGSSANSADLFIYFVRFCFFFSSFFAVDVEANVLMSNCCTSKRVGLLGKPFHKKI